MSALANTSRRNEDGSITYQDASKAEMTGLVIQFFNACDGEQQSAAGSGTRGGSSVQRGEQKGKRNQGVWIAVCWRQQSGRVGIREYVTESSSRLLVPAQEGVRRSNEVNKRGNEIKECGSPSSIRDDLNLVVVKFISIGGIILSESLRVGVRGLNAVQHRGVFNLKSKVHLETSGRRAWYCLRAFSKNQPIWSRGDQRRRIKE
ncbi:hypothetical protein C8R46DRAFT_1038261 [Mycena filopes]|nr:hypothetical protein C8R46DRAFT_1038261 [Mycena filopes]